MHSLSWQELSADNAQPPLIEAIRKVYGGPMDVIIALNKQYIASMERALQQCVSTLMPYEQDIASIVKGEGSLSNTSHESPVAYYKEVLEHLQNSDYNAIEFSELAEMPLYFEMMLDHTGLLDKLMGGRR